MKLLNQHPCFNEEAKHTHGRVHLPIASKCNIQCNYCNRKYDCVNESRPEVTSNVITPMQSLQYLRLITNRLDTVSVVGIAGPGDAFANVEQTLETLRLIKSAYPTMMLCLSTNGLDLFDYIPKLAELGVSHVTLTINGLDPQQLTQVYSWVRFNKQIYRGQEGAEILLREQLRCIPELKRHGILVKINTIIIPGVNDNNMESLAAEMARLGADTMNCIPLKPVANTAFAHIAEPTSKQMEEVFAQVAKHITPTTHCTRCGADAVGLLGQEYSQRHYFLKQVAIAEARSVDERNRVAVATYEGMLVNLHLGAASELWVYEQNGDEIRFVAKRTCPPAGGGEDRWRALAEIFSDCRAVLTAGAGIAPTNALMKRGITVFQISGVVSEGLKAIFDGKDMSALMKNAAKCRGNCSDAGCA